MHCNLEGNPCISLNLNWGVGSGGGGDRVAQLVAAWHREQAKGKLFINSGQMWSRSLVQIQKAPQISDPAKTRDLFSSNRNVSCEPSYPLLENLNIY